MNSVIAFAMMSEVAMFGNLMGLMQNTAIPTATQNVAQSNPRMVNWKRGTVVIGGE